MGVTKVYLILNGKLGLIQQGNNTLHVVPIYTLLKGVTPLSPPLSDPPALGRA